MTVGSLAGGVLRGRDIMNKFTGGLLAGGLIGAASVALVMSDSKTRKRVARDGKRATRKANAVFENIHDLF